METKTEANPTNTGAAAPDTAVQFLHKAKKATRRRFNAEDKIRIVIECKVATTIDPPVATKTDPPLLHF